jgi:cytochrome b561
MKKTTTTSTYDTPSRVLHWLTAIAVVAAFVLGPEGFGRLMRSGVDPATHADIAWHESLGVLVFCLTIVRLVWLALRPSIPVVPLARWMDASAQLAHISLWALMLALPVTAILALGSEGHPLTLLGNLRINDMPWIQNAAFAKWADWGDVHGFLGDAIVAIAGLHAAAAIYHHFVLKDGVLASMLLRK